MGRGRETALRLVRSGSSQAGVSQAILKAMKVPMEFALGTLRLSVGRHSTPAEIDTAADLIVAEAKKQKQQ